MKLNFIKEKLKKLYSKYAHIVPIVIAGTSVIITVYAIFFLASNTGVTKKVLTMLMHNFAFFLLMLSGLVYYIYRKFKNPLEVTIYELIAQAIIGAVSTVAVFGFLLFQFSDVKDYEIWNGYVEKSVYVEAWTEEVTYYEEVCTGSGDSQSCRSVQRTRNDYHYPEWYLVTSNYEKVRIAKSAYRAYASCFGNEKKNFLLRSNQVSFGDGNSFITKYKGQCLKPSSVAHEYVNYLKASKSIKKTQGSAKAYEKYLSPYPEVSSIDGFGGVYFDRIINTGVTIPAKWNNAVEKNLNNTLAYLGAKKQVNLVLYVVGTSDKNFIHALKEHWINGKKNDVVLVLGITKFPKIDWADVMVFSGNEELKVALRDEVSDMKDISNANAFSKVFTDNVKKHFERIPMEKLEYLLHDISLPFWIYLCIFMITFINAMMISMYFENNSIKKRK